MVWLWLWLWLFFFFVFVFCGVIELLGMIICVYCTVCEVLRVKYQGRYIWWPFALLLLFPTFLHDTSFYHLRVSMWNLRRKEGRKKERKKGYISYFSTSTLQRARQDKKAHLTQHDNIVIHLFIRLPNPTQPIPFHSNPPYHPPT